MGWTSHAASASRPPRRHSPEPSSAAVDEFSDLVPELSDPGQFEATTPPRSDDVSAPTAASSRPDTYRFWEQGVAEIGSDHPAPDHGLPPAASEAGLAFRAVESNPPPSDSQSPVRPSEASAQAADMAWSLLEIISLSTDSTQPQERGLAADALLNLLPRLTGRILMAISDRISLMESPPRLIVNQLVRDQRPEVSGPLLEKSVAVSDQDLMEVIRGGRTHSIRMIARRRILSAALCNAVIATSEPSAILTLVRNPGAAISHEGFIRLNVIARQHPSLQAPLATRPDLPAPVAFELFWTLPVELRRYVLSRFLTDSKTLEKILKITKSVDHDAAPEGPAAGFPSRERIDRFAALVASGDSVNAAKLLAELAGVQEKSAARIIADSDGEPIAAALKALGVPRNRFQEIVQVCRQSPACALRDDRKVDELHSLFDTLSFNKARVLLTYWDWAAAQSGPYDLPAARAH
jgi:uncharacterized protein (DUF2336 family)